MNWRNQIPNIDGFTDEDIGLLDKYFDFYHALESGARDPSSGRQRHFVLLCRNLLTTAPTSAHEAAYSKYLKKLKGYSLESLKEEKIDYDKMLGNSKNAHGDPKKRLIEQRKNR